MLALGRGKERVTAASLLLRSWTEVKSVVDLPASEVCLKKNIINCLAGCIIESLYTEPIVSVVGLVGVLGVGAKIDDSIVNEARIERRGKERSSPYSGVKRQETYCNHLPLRSKQLL